MRQQAAAASDEAAVSGGPDSVPTTPPDGRTTWLRHVEDPELAAYNARLAELAAQGPKTWRARESVVVRREQ